MGSCTQRYLPPDTSEHAPPNPSLAIRFRREDMLSTLLAAGEMHAGKPRKQVPSYAAPYVDGGGVES